MYSTLPIKNNALTFHGYRINPSDIRKCLLQLTDLSGVLNSFSIRILKNERPRRKLIIDVELIIGFAPEKYAADCYLHELIANLRKISRSFSEFIRLIPADVFPELHFYRFNNLVFSESLYKIKSRYFF